LKLLGLSLAALLGLLWVLSSPQLPAWESFAAASAVIALPALGIHRWSGACPVSVAGESADARPIALWTLLLLMSGALAVAWAGLRFEQSIEARLPAVLEESNQRVRLVVRDLPQLSQGPFEAWRLEADVTLSEQDNTRAGRSFRAMVIWPVEVLGPTELIPGQVWEASAKLRSPAGTRNFYGFDFETWAFQRGVVLSATIRGSGGNPPNLVGVDTSFATSIDRLRHRIRTAIESVMPAESHWGVMSGLVVGDQRAISSEDWVLFSVTGVSHLMSISGMHVTMFAVMARWLTTLLWSGLSRPPLYLALHIPSPIAGAIAASLAAFSYALLAGFNLPAQRTAIMVTVAAATTIAGRSISSWSIIGATLIAILLWDPSAPLAPGFWLSFFAVAILFGQPTKQRGLSNPEDASNPSSASRPSIAKGERDGRRILERVGVGLWSATRAQLAISIGVAPLTIVFFQQLSLVGPIANAVAIPVVTFLVTPLAMLGSVFALFSVGWPLAMADAVFGELHKVLEWMAGFEWASIGWHAPAAWAAVVAILGVTLALQSSLPRWRHLGWVGLLALLTGGASPVPEGEMRLHVFDVGQGSAMLIETREYRLLVDTGPPFGESNSVQRVILPQLVAMGIGKLDGVVVTHADADHSTGLDVLLPRMNPDWVLSSLSEEQWQGHLGHSRPEAAHIRCVASMSWVWNGVWFRTAHPFPDAPPPAKQIGRNEDSCVLEAIDASGRRLIVAGDLPAAQERDVIARTPWLGRGVGASLAGSTLDGSTLDGSTVVLMSHHGSRTSSSLEWLMHTSPGLAIAQAGYRNRFGHPHAEVLRRHRDLSIPIERTDLAGGLRLVAKQSGWQIERAVDGNRFWHRPRREGD